MDKEFWVVIDKQDGQLVGEHNNISNLYEREYLANREVNGHTDRNRFEVKNASWL